MNDLRALVFYWCDRKFRIMVENTPLKEIVDELHGHMRYAQRAHIEQLVKEYLDERNATQ